MTEILPTSVPPDPNESKRLVELLRAIRACQHCAVHLPHGPRPIVQAGARARLLIIGQAPGARVHASGIPWDDPSGERLRRWMDMDKATFYNTQHVAIVPMGYCYPGKGPSGDLPPRRECAELWLDRLLACLPNIGLTLLIGQYAQRHFLGKAAAGGVGKTVAAYAQFAPDIVPLPHPSPRNIAWFLRNPWFESALLPSLQSRIHGLLATGKGSTQ
jgi:uracil-DNA glycosylase